MPPDVAAATRRSAMRRVIVDVDAGSDDAMALMLLLAGERERPYRVEAITCTFGNTTLEHVTRNVLLILEAMQRTDVRVHTNTSKSKFLGVFK